MSEDWLSSFIIYYDNLSNYYLICLIVSFSAVMITWWFTHSKFKPPREEIVNERELEDDDSSDRQDGSLLSQIKMARQDAIVQSLSAGLTEEQLEEERETEKQQLAAIFQLLQEQGEKFQVGSMEELEDQLRLYRR